ncbi:hypothetical protein WS75_26175 [Burkholderia sp. FL-7-2-10-S1-D7]|nr:hypothetical protein WS75_26175 [Burkholderia sp. FL-7-2-10-S1-D7]
MNRSFVWRVDARPTADGRRRRSDVRVRAPLLQIGAGIDIGAGFRSTAGFRDVDASALIEVTSSRSG